MIAIQETQESEKLRLRQKLTALEGRQRDYFDLFMRDSADPQVRSKLEEAERDLKDVQGALAATENEMKSALRAIRQRIMDLVNSELNAMETKIKEMRVRRQTIHDAELPAAKVRVAELEEERAHIDQQCDEIARRIQDLSGLDLLDMPHGVQGAGL